MVHMQLTLLARLTLKLDAIHSAKSSLAKLLRITSHKAVLFTVTIMRASNLYSTSFASCGHIFHLYKYVTIYIRGFIVFRKSIQGSTVLYDTKN